MKIKSLLLLFTVLLTFSALAQKGTIIKADNFEAIQINDKNFIQFEIYVKLMGVAEFLAYPTIHVVDTKSKEEVYTGALNYYGHPGPKGAYKLHLSKEVLKNGNYTIYMRSGMSGDEHINIRLKKKVLVEATKLQLAE